MIAWFQVLWAQFRHALVAQAQYRVAALMWILGMIVEPVIYLVVWGTVAEAQGGMVAGYTAGAFAAYYIIWTLVRQMNIALTPYSFEHRIRNGRLNGELMRPIHPLVFDLGWFGAMKVVYFIVWLPVAALLVWIFQPTFSGNALDLLWGSLAMIGGFVSRFMLLWALGLVTFWLTRVSAVFELYFTIELLLSGRLVPMDLLPVWLQDIARFLPFQWAFGFPIEATMGRLSASELLFGFGAQAVWSLVGLGLLAVFWRSAIRRYSSVGG